MSPSEQSGREKEIFEQALDLPSAEARLAYAQGACGGDTALLARVRALLQAHDEPGGFLPEKPGAVSDPTINHAMAESPEKPGTIIGRYKLLERIGEGGFGSVYMAEQEVPVRRRVALKVIKLGMDTKEVVARFEAERQALAMMDHPNIAKVLDGGATDTGRPYFVMELVKGVPITTYCDQRKLSTPARLELFMLVCQAVQHAHQKGIIHRDLKPSNILVTEQDDRPVPKVIDFGVARATQARLTEKTMFTQFHQLVGTPAYMSPEQTGLANLDIDTRSDIYSLGVLLYELLTGCTPFDSKKLLEAGYEGIMRIIREVEPPKPSTRLSSLSVQELTELGGRRQEEPRRLGRRVQGDLDWIVMKALEKDRTRRYETATSLAQDLQRHLVNEPIIARPAGNFYRFRKLVRRHRLICTAVTALVAVWLAGTVVSTYLAVRAVQAEKKLASEEEVASNVARFLNVYIFGQLGAANPGLTLSQALDRAVPHIDETFRNEPRIRAELDDIVGLAYARLEDYEKSIRHLEMAVTARRGSLSSAPEAAWKSMDTLASVYQRAGRLAAAIALREEILRWKLAGVGRSEPLDIASSRTQLGFTFLAAGEKEKGVFQVETALRETQAAFPATDMRVLGAMENLADAYHNMARSAEAIALYEKTLALEKFHPMGPSHPVTLATMDQLARAYQEAGRFQDAIILGEEILALRKSRRELGPDHPDTLATMHHLALAYRDAGRFTEAERLLVSAYESLKTSDARQEQSARRRLPEVLTDLIRLYEAANRPEMAAEWQLKAGPTAK